MPLSLVAAYMVPWIGWRLHGELREWRRRRG